MEHKYRKKNRVICPGELGITVIGVISTLAALGVLLCLLLGTGETRAAAGNSAGNLQIMDRFNMVIGNAVSDSLDGVLNLRKTYWLSEDALKAPKPDPACAGSTQNPKSLEGLVKDAQERLGIQEMLFSTDVEIFPGSEIRYYLDDTIFSISWQQRVDYCVYSMTEVRIAHPSQFRRFLAGGEFGSGVLYTTTEMANSVNAVSAASGDYYAYRPCGVTVFNGEVCRDISGGEYMDNCFIDDQGDMHFVKRTEMLTTEQVEQYVKDNNIRFSLSFGPILIVDGEVVMRGDYALGEVTRNFSRAAICQQGPLHYVMAMANTAPRLTSIPTMEQFADDLKDLGIEKAYALDGGQTATMIANGKVFNNIDYGTERLISDIIYFATAIPDGEKQEAEK